MEAEQRHKTMLHREQGRGVAGRGQSRPGRRLVLRLESEGRAKRSLEEKQGGSWIETVQWRDSEERRGACERNVGIVYYSIVEMKRKEDSG